MLNALQSCERLNNNNIISKISNDGIDVVFSSFGLPCLSG